MEMIVLTSQVFEFSRHKGLEFEIKLNFLIDFQTL